MVLIVEHEDVQGTLGVVLNRPTAIGVGQVLEQWTELATEPSVVFRGGPVAPNSALALALVPGKDEPLGWRALDGAPALARLGLLDLDTPPRLLAPAITSLRVYAGYAGWSPGQLEAEIDEGAWYVLTAQPGDVFAADPDRLWRQVLRRQDGDMAFLATYPDDPTPELTRGTTPGPPMSGSAGLIAKTAIVSGPAEPDKSCVLRGSRSSRAGSSERVRLALPASPLPRTRGSPATWHPVRR